MKKKMFTNQVNADLLKNFKKLAIDLERPINDVLEEAMRNLLKNYDKPKSKKDNSSTPVLPFSMAFLIEFNTAFSESPRFNDLRSYRIKLWSYYQLVSIP